jgi:hypothetical protein
MFSGKKYVLLLAAPAVIAGKLVLPDGASAAFKLSDSGQDGAYSNNIMSFTFNGNDTVTDNNIGLMWQKGDPNPQQQKWFQASGTPHGTHNPSSLDV